MRRRKKEIPLLEVALSLFSCYAATLLFLSPEIIHTEAPGIYGPMAKIMPGPGWAISMLTAALVKTLGLILNHKRLRQVGLGMSAVIYLTITVCAAFTFPNFTFGIFFILGFMAGVTVFYVEETEL